jgi:hypothetical protein
MTARASLTAVGLCVPAVVALAGPAAAAPPAAPPPAHTAHSSAAGINLTVAIDDIRWAPSGNRAPAGLLFSHDAHARGRYSVIAAGAIQSGTVAAGFILGCGVSAAGGIQIGITPNAGILGAVQPNITLTNPPAVNSISPSVGGNLGLSEGDQVTLEPGQVTAVVVASAPLTSTSTYPYRLSFDDAGINVSQCVSPGSAVPFVTAAVSTDSATTQTTAYGDQFAF